MVKNRMKFILMKPWQSCVSSGNTMTTILRLDIFTPVKAADRIANMRRAQGTNLGVMYRRELPAFLEVAEGAISPEMFAALKVLGE